jgi:predicted  nucleic acid-binding Zn-ribbon protein
MIRDANQIRDGIADKRMGMTDLEERILREREEIVARVASFRATQQKFQREREEFVSHTWQNIRKGEPIPYWS